MRMLIRIMILYKLTLRIKLDNVCHSDLKNGVTKHQLLSAETFGRVAS